VSMECETGVSVFTRLSSRLFCMGVALGLSHAKPRTFYRKRYGLLRLPEEPAEPEFYAVRSYRNRR